MLNWLANEKNILLAIRSWMRYKNETGNVPKLANLEKMMDIAQ